MSEMKTLKFPGDSEPREIVDAKAREDISKLSEDMLTEAELSNAVDNALAQAKESGEFDGPQGEAGQDGADGGYYSPAVTQPDANTMRVSFTPSKADMPAVLDTDITIPSGGPGSVAVDSTLTVSGQAADAKATGDAIRSLSEEVENLGGGTGTGAPGPAGADGVGIQSVEQTTTSTEDGGTNVITVTKTDGTSSTFAVRNGSRGSVGPAGADGQPGADGKDGLDGTPGQDGVTPTIGENGNWYLGDTDTGKPSRGETGPQGPQGETGPQGPKGDTGDTGPVGEAGGFYTPEVTQPDENTLRVAFTPSKEGMPTVADTDITLPAGPKGETGPQGPAGPQGETGEAGPAGPQGADGYTPVRGTDYWTEADIAEIKSYVDEAILGGAW